MPEVILKITPDIANIKPAADELAELGEIDKKNAEAFKAANKVFAEKGVTVKKAVSGMEQLASSTKKMVGAIAGGAINKAYDDIQKIASGTKDASAQTQLFIKSVEEAKKQLQSLPSGTAAFKELDNEIKAATQSFDALSTAASTPLGRLTQLRQVLGELKQSGLDATNTYRTLNTEADLLDSDINKLSEDFLNLNRMIILSEQRLASLSTADPEFESLNKEVQAARIGLQNFGKQAISTRGQLRQMREALTQMEEAGLDGTKVFQDLAVGAAALEDQIGDTQARIRTMASDTFQFDAAIQSIQGVASAFSIAQGAAALFGDENEDVQKALLRVNAAMSILNGLQQLQNLLQKQSAISLATEATLRRVAAASTALQSLAESRYTVVRFLATKAQLALNAAMAANPAGILLLAITAAAGALLLFTNNSEDAAKSQEDLAEASKKVIDALNEEIAIQERLRNARIGGLTGLRQEVAELQARGAARSKVLETEKRAIEEEIQNARIRRETFAGLAGAEKEYDEANAEIVRLQGERRVKELESRRAYAEESKELVRKALEDEKKATMAFLDDLIAANEIAVIEARNNFEKLVAEIALINAKLRKELANPDLGPNQRLSAELKAGQEIKKVRQDLIGDLEKVSAQEVDLFKTKQNEQVLASAQRAAALLEHKRVQSEAELGIIQDQANKEKEIRKGVIDYSLQLAQGLSQAVLNSSRAQAEAESDILKQKLDSGLITQKEYDRQLRIIKRRQAQEEKRMAIFQATINGAAAVVKTLATAPWPINIVMAGVVGGLALAEIVTIASKPIPEFWKGTKYSPEGPAWVAERGPELIHHKGKWAYADTPTITNLPLGSQVIPAADTARLLSNWGVSEAGSIQYIERDASAGIDYGKLGAVIGKEISKMPLNVFGFDKDGPFHYTTTISNRQAYLRNRFGTR